MTSKPQTIVYKDKRPAPLGRSAVGGDIADIIDMGGASAMSEAESLGGSE